MSAYNGSKIPVVGKCSLSLPHKNNSFRVSFIVVDSDTVPIPGLKASKCLEFIKRTCRTETNNETFFSEFHDCFREIGTLNTTHHIEVKDNVKPLVTPVRKVPHVFKPKSEKELKRILDFDIIELIEKPTDWINSLVIAEKIKRKVTHFPQSSTTEQCYKRQTPPSHR